MYDEKSQHVSIRYYAEHSKDVKGLSPVVGDHLKVFLSLDY